MLHFDAPQHISLSKENVTLTQEIQQTSNAHLKELLDPNFGFTWVFPFLLLAAISYSVIRWLPRKRKKNYNYRAEMAKLRADRTDREAYVSGLDSILKNYLNTKGTSKAKSMSSEEIADFLKKTYAEETSKSFFHLKDMAKFGHYPLDKQDTLNAEKLVLEVIKKIERSTM